MKTREDDQQELFEEFKGPKKGIERFRERHASGQKPKISVSIEQLVFIAIMVIMTVALFFSLGVERGKRLSGAEAEGLPVKASQARVVQPEKDAGQEALVPKTAAGTEERKPAAQETPRARQEKTPVTQEGPARYTIQIVTYRSEDAASRKIAALKKDGLVAFIIPKGGLFQVCVGRYGGIQQARDARKDLLLQYKDCFIRNIETD